MDSNNHDERVEAIKGNLDGYDNPAFPGDHCYDGEPISDLRFMLTSYDALAARVKWLEEGRLMIKHDSCVRSCYHWPCRICDWISREPKE